jgi:hypothetical protein
MVALFVEKKPLPFDFFQNYQRKQKGQSSSP